jgi:hypothetical protein
MRTLAVGIEPRAQGLAKIGARVHTLEGHDERIHPPAVMLQSLICVAAEP